MSFRFRPWMLVSAAWVAPALLAFASRVAQNRLWGDPSPSAAQLLFASLDWLVYGLFVPAIFAISVRWPLTGAGRRRWSWLVHLLGSLLFCAAWAAVGTVLKLLLRTESFDNGIAFSFLSWFYITLPFGVGVYFGMVGIEHAIRHVSVARDLQAQAVRAEAQLTAARLSALEARLNPHFLFNALNTVAVLIRDGNGPSANRVVEQLSEVLRMTIDRPERSEVPLGEELHLVERYLAVEQARFSDRLRPDIDVPEELSGAAVPVFALQHLVENAIRHGVASSIAAGVVRITARREGGSLVVIVIDDGIGILHSGVVITGRGLDNTRARLRVLHGDGSSLTVTSLPGGGTIAELRVPYRELPFDREMLDSA